MGNLIFVEGSNGVGKTTMVNRIVSNSKAMEDNITPVVMLNEPYGEIERPYWISQDQHEYLSTIRKMLKSGSFKKDITEIADLLIYTVLPLSKFNSKDTTILVYLISLCRYAQEDDYPSFLSSVAYNRLSETYRNTAIDAAFNVAKTKDGKDAIIAAVLFTVSRVFSLSLLLDELKKNQTDIDIIVDRSVVSTVVFQLYKLFELDSSYSSWFGLLMFDSFIRPLEEVLLSLNEIGVNSSIVLLSNSPFIQDGKCVDVFEDDFTRNEIDRKYDDVFMNDEIWKLFMTDERSKKSFFDSNKFPRTVVDLNVMHINDFNTINDLLRLIYDI
jgi:thymidylate kinase